MRIIPTRIHGLIDYMTAALLVAAPWLFGFARGGVETWLPVALGVAIALYSLATAYEWGLFPALTVPTHLLLDAGGGILLAVSPWMFSFYETVWVPHLAVGLFELATAALTEHAARRSPAMGRVGQAF